MADRTFFPKPHGIALAGVSAVALAAAIGLAPTPAYAACDATAPGNGTTVTCDTTAPDPETDAIIAPGSTDVDVDFQAGAGLEVTGGPAIELGSGALIELMNNNAITTFGDNAAGVLIHDAGGVFVMQSLQSALQTNGANSTLIDVDLGASSSISLVGEDSSFGTFGDGSGVLKLFAGDTSDITVILQDSTLTSQGANATLLEVLRGDNSLTGTILVDSDLTAQGDGSAGIVFRVTNGDDDSSDSFSLSGVTVETGGNDAPAFLIEPGGDDSLRTVNMLNNSFTTVGGNSAGVSIGGLGNTPNLSASLTNVTIDTAGDDSVGLFVGGARAGSNIDVELDGVTVSTAGANSHGAVLGENIGTGIDSELTVTGLSSITTGANAHALVIGENTTLTLDGANVGATTANGTIVNGTIDSFDNLVATGDRGRAVQNNGIIYDTFTVSAPVVGNLANNGLIESDTGAGGVAVQFTGTTSDIFELQTQGVVIGSVEAGAGTDTFILGGEGTASFDVALIGTQYNDFEEFEKEDGSVWTLTGTNAVAAPFLVSEGTLVNNAVLENVLMTVGPDGRLEGVGTLGGLTIDGTLAPGNSIGTMNVADNVVFNAGSTYQVELNNGGFVAGTNNDLLNATGTVTINGGTVHLTPENGTDTGSTYTPGTYTIVTAAGGVTGTFDTLTDDYAFLSFTDSYDASNVYLTSSIAVTSFCLSGYTANQCATGDAAFSLGSGNAVFDAVLGLSSAEAPIALNLLSGEIHASGQHVIDQTFSLFSRTLRRQGAAGLNGGSNMNGEVYTAPLAYGPAAPTEAGVVAIDDATTSAYANERVANAWLAPLGGRGTVDADGNAAQLDWWTAGLAGGYEGPLDVATGNAWLGFGLGYLRSHGAVDARLSTMDADNFDIGVYGGWADGPWTLSGSLAYAASKVATTRRIVFTGFDQTATADYWNHTVGFSGEAAYGFDVAPGTTLSPVATLDAGWSGHGGFTETGAGALNLSAGSESWTRLDTGLGVAVQHVILTETGKLTLDGRLLWEHAFADVVPTQNLAFAGSPTSFTIRGPNAGRDRLRLGVGAAFEATEDMTIRASYTGLFSGSQQNHTANIGLNVRF